MFSPFLLGTSEHTLNNYEMWYLFFTFIKAILRRKFASWEKNKSL